MNIQQLLVDRLRESALTVFSTMLGVELSVEGFHTETEAPEVNGGVVSLIGLAGNWVGTGALICSPEVACRCSSLMLMTECDAVDEEVLDALAELTNMVIGGVKNDLEPHVGPLGLSIPTVVYGRNFRTRSMATTEWIVMRFLLEGCPFLMRIALAPACRVAHGAAHGAQQHSSDLPVGSGEKNANHHTCY